MSVSPEEIRADEQVKRAEDELRDAVIAHGNVDTFLFTEEFSKLYGKLASARLRAAIRINREKRA